MGTIRAALGKFNEARKDLEEAIKLGMRDSMIWHNLGNVYGELGLKQEAEDAYAKSRELAKESGHHIADYDPDRGENLTS